MLLRSKESSKTSNCISVPGEGGGIIRISSNRDDRMGAKTQPKKILRALSHSEFQNHKNFQNELNDITPKIETLITEWLCFFIHHTIWDEQEPFWHIDMTDCTLTSFMKKTQCNALNIKTVAKQVWCYFLRGTTPPGCAGPITNLRLF